MVYQRKIFVRDTDVTGRIYFGCVFDCAVEAFQLLLEEKQCGVQDLCSLGYGLPIVHASADYFSAITVGDEVAVFCKLDAIGKRSFTMVAKIENSQSKELVAEVTLVHAFVKEGESRALEFPTKIEHLLSELPRSF